MTKIQILTALWTGVFLLVHLGVIARVILRPHREPASRVAWIVVMIVLPVIGILTYILLGETSIGRRRVSRMCAVLATMPDLTKGQGMDAPNLQPKIPETYAHLFRSDTRSMASSPWWQLRDLAGRFQRDHRVHGRGY
jgi:hypothetical protein